MNTDELQRRIGSRIIRRNDPGYESARQRVLWNRLIPERRPELIVVPEDADGVARAVRFARERGLLIAVRSGGHSWCGAPLRDDALLLDLSALNGASVDPEKRTAAVGPAATNGTLAALLAREGLAFPVGHCPSVAIGGYLLGGGFGWNTGSWGPACFSVAAIEAVTADGALVTASETENPDLFWAARGAGAGFFAVVTRYHLNLHALPRKITTATSVYPLEDAGELASWLAGERATLGQQVELTLFLAAAPPGAAASATHRMACVVTGTAFVDSTAEAARLLAPLEEGPLGPRCLLRSGLEPTPFEVLFARMDARFPAEHRYVADTLWSNAAPAEVLTVAGERLNQAPSPKSLVLAVLTPPPPHDAPPLPDAAFSMSDGMFAACYAIWEDAADDEANRVWHRKTMSALGPFAAGHYIGESDIAATPSRAAGSFAPQNWQRLAELRKKYDPDRRFVGFFET